MKEVKLKPDEYKSIKVRTMQPNEWIIVKSKGNKVFEKEIPGKSGAYEAFTTYSVGCIHDGNECYLQITGAIAKVWRTLGTGDIVKIMALPSNLKGGKQYVVIKEETPYNTPVNPTDITEQNRIDFEKILSHMIEQGTTMKDIDDKMVEDTFFADFGYIPAEAKRVTPLFIDFIARKI